MKNIFRSLALPVVFCLTACAEKNQPAKETEVQVQINAQSLKRAVVACGRPKVREFDDGSSDPKTIALKVASACEEEFQNYIEFTSQSLEANDASTSDVQEANSNESKLETFLPMVLQYRYYIKNKLRPPN